MLTNSKSSYITSQEELKHLTDLIRKKGLVAIDTEFTRRTTYYPILSIIQIALKTDDENVELFIIDCLLDLNLDGIFAIIADKKIVKIFHSAAQDLQIFYHQSRLLPQNIIDTQVMANLCGFDFNIGYSRLVEQLFQEKLSKKYQNSNWQARPLDKKQLEYALLDVFFLPRIYQELSNFLAAKNRLNWYFEEVEIFIEKTLSSSVDNLKKKFSFRNRSAKEIFQIKSLILWRETWAQKIDVPRQHLLKDELLEKIVVDSDFGLDLGKKIDEKMRGEIEEIIAAEPGNLVREKRLFMSDRQKSLCNEAKEIVVKIAKKENLKEQFLITNLDLKKAVCEKDFLNKNLSKWRYEILGKELETLITH